MLDLAELFVLKTQRPDSKEVHWPALHLEVLVAIYKQPCTTTCFTHPFWQQVWWLCRIRAARSHSAPRQPSALCLTSVQQLIQAAFYFNCTQT